MKVNLILAASIALASTVAQADTTNPSASQGAPAVTAPKNLARQHLGANLLLYTPSNQTYAPTEAAAAWLDDDIATGWPALTGKQDYLLALPEPELVNNFAISAKSATGTVTLYAGDEAAPPGAASWTVLEKDVPIALINEKLGKPFGRFAKYILIETNLTDSGPWYSLYLYGDKDSTAYRVQQRAQPVDPRTEFGPYVNPETAFSLSSLYAHGQVIAAGGDSANWQNAIDDNPATGTFVPATQSDAGFAIRYDHPYAIQRISVLTDAGAKGKLDFFVVNEPAPAGSTASHGNDSQYIKVANEIPATGSDAPASTTPVSAVPDIANLQPIASMQFDGSNPRASVDFTPTTGTVLLARWTPDTAGQPLDVKEVNSFGDVALNDYELSPDTVGDASASGGKETISADGKETIPSDGKETLPDGQQVPPVGEGFPEKTAFIPGVPVFPPNIPFSP